MPHRSWTKLCLQVTYERGRYIGSSLTFTYETENTVHKNAPLGTPWYLNPHCKRPFRTIFKPDQCTSTFVKNILSYLSVFLSLSVLSPFLIPYIFFWSFHCTQQTNCICRLFNNYISLSSHILVNASKFVKDTE